MRAEVLKPTPRLLVKGIVGMLNYTYFWLEPDGPSTPGEIAGMFLDAVIGGIPV